MSSDLTVTVNASDLLWVLTEYGLLCLLADTIEKGAGTPPSMDAAFRLSAALPIGDITLPPEAAPSQAIASVIASQAGLK